MARLRDDSRVLFVYGSLKRGGRHHDELRGAAYLGDAVTVPGYALEALGDRDGDYLALVPSPLESGVPGELFLVDDALLSLLDEFEGPAYRRAAVELAGFLGDKSAEARTSRMALAYLRRTR